jgi:hypothetical protein
VSRRALVATASALLIGAAGFVLGQQLDLGATSPEPLPQRIATQPSRIPIPNLGAAAAIPQLSTAAGPRTTRRAP